jgi:hypothetical protein
MLNIGQAIVAGILPFRGPNIRRLRAINYEPLYIKLRISEEYVVDRRGRIRHIVTGIPGSSHDATAIRWSNTFITFLNNLPDNLVVLGDPAYRGYPSNLPII